MSHDEQTRNRKSRTVSQGVGSVAKRSRMAGERHGYFACQPSFSRAVRFDRKAARVVLAVALCLLGVPMLWLEPAIGGGMMGWGAAMLTGH